MRYACGWLLAVVLMPAAAAANGLCGARDDAHLRIALTAIVAHELCEDVGELSDRDTGALANASGVDVKSKSCQPEIGIEMLRMKATYERSPGDWCTAARTVLANFPLTATLVGGEATKCTEIDRVSGLLSSFERRCPKLKISTAGSAVRELSPIGSICAKTREAEIDQRIAKFAKVMNGDVEKAAAWWCDAAFSEHVEQVSAFGMKPFVERK